MEEERFRDPIHGFIYVSPLEMKIVDSRPFQRLRRIHQLAFTNLVFHGAEHTRFGHSLGVMELATKVFNTIINKKPLKELWTCPDQIQWYRQIVRLIALVHDLGHPPFSHASESVLPNGVDHETYTEKIVCTTEVGDIITDIGNDLVKKTNNKSVDITPNLICDIYLGRVKDADFILLRKLLDSELDVDKMDYLLRDSYYCGVNYGTYDLNRLINSLTAYHQSESGLRLAVEEGGLHAVEEFILARYFMFVQVYFHRTRRLYDIMLTNFLKSHLPNGVYPENTCEYLEWDDNYVLDEIMLANKNQWARKIRERELYREAYRTPTHSEESEKREFRLIEREIKEKMGSDKIIIDKASKLPHKIPSRVELNDERAILMLKKFSELPDSISNASEIIKNITKSINLYRIYTDDSIYEKVKLFCEEREKTARGILEDPNDDI